MTNACFFKGLSKVLNSSTVAFCAYQLQRNSTNKQ